MESTLVLSPSAECFLDETKEGNISIRHIAKPSPYRHNCEFQILVFRFVVVNRDLIVQGDPLRIGSFEFAILRLALFWNNGIFADSKLYFLVSKSLGNIMY